MKIVITGGASGLGEAITRKLAADPAHELTITYHRSEANARALATALPNVEVRPLDLADPASVAAFADGLEALAPDVLIHNAIGGLTRKHAHKLPAEAWLASFRTNVLPVVEIGNRAIALFRKRKAGRIITVLTDYLVGAPPLGLAEYVANKAYLESVAKSWAVENAAHGITSNCVLPSMMATGLTADLDERAREALVQALPSGRLLETAEAAEVVAFLVTCTPYVNGARIVVNGARAVD